MVSTKKTQKPEIVATEDSLIIPELKPIPKNAPKREKEAHDLLEAFRGVILQLHGNLNELKSWDDFLTEVGATTSAANLLAPQFNIPFSPSALRELYKHHTWIYIAINAVARVISGLPVVVKETKREKDDETGEMTLVTKELDSHSFLDIINDPNPKIKDTKYQFFWRLIIEILATGKAYIWVRENLSELEIIRNGEIKPIINKKGEIDGYEPEKKGKGRPAYFDNNEIIEIRLPNPFNAIEGMAPAIAGILPVLINKYQDEFQVSFYLSGGRRPSLLTNKGNTSIKQLMVIARSFENMFIGRGKGNKTVALPKDVDHKEFGTSQQEQALGELKGMSRDEILALFRIPPSEAGILDDASYANAALMSRDFWEKMAIPFMKFITDAFNTSVFFKDNAKNKNRVAGERIFMSFDLSNVSALQEDEKKRVEGLAKRDWLTVNEKRDIDGLKPLDDERYNTLPWIEFIESIKPKPQTLALPEKFFNQTEPSVTVEEIFGNDQAPVLVDIEKDQRVSRLSSLVEIFTVDRETRVKRYLKQWREAAINAIFQTIDGKKNGKKVDPYNKTNRYIDYDLLKNPEKIFLTKWLQSPLPGLTYKQGDELNEIMRLITEDSAEFRNQYLKDYEKDLLPAYRIGFNETVIGTTIGGIADEDILKDLRATGKRQTNQLDSTTLENIRDTLAGEYAKEEQTARSLAASIKDLFVETYKNRPLSVAKHEIYSTVAGGEIKGQSTIKTIYPDALKVWNHGGNFDARDHHKRADKVMKVPIDKPFVLVPEGGKAVSLRSPRDPSAPIGETINCGCYATYQLGNPKTK